MIELSNDGRGVLGSVWPNQEKKTVPHNLLIETRVLTDGVSTVRIGEENIFALDLKEASYFSLFDLEQERTQILFDVISCEGVVSFLSASRLVHLRNKVYDISFNKQEIDWLHYIVTLNKTKSLDRVHFSLKTSTKSDQTGVTFTNFRVYSLSADIENPLSLFETPGNGQSFAWINNDQLTVQIGVPTCKKKGCNYFEVVGAKYTLHLSNNPRIRGANVHCGAFVEFSSSRKEVPLKSFPIEIKDFRRRNKANYDEEALVEGTVNLESFSKEVSAWTNTIYITVTAALSIREISKPNAQDYLFNYGDMIVARPLSEGKGKSSLGLILGIVFAVLGAFLLVGLLYCRYKSIKARMNQVETRRPSSSFVPVPRDFEMNDRYQALVDNSNL